MTIDQQVFTQQDCRSCSFFRKQPLGCTLRIAYKALQLIFYHTICINEYKLLKTCQIAVVYFIGDPKFRNFSLNVNQNTEIFLRFCLSILKS